MSFRPGIHIDITLYAGKTPVILIFQIAVSYTHLDVYKRQGYAGFYGILSACNAAVHYADKVEGLSETRINELVSEARFIRAHALYLSLIHIYGGNTTPGHVPKSCPQCE